MTEILASFDAAEAERQYREHFDRAGREWGGEYELWAFPVLVKSPDRSSPGRRAIVR
jgi:hypothetical protein